MTLPTSSTPAVAAVAPTADPPPTPEPRGGTSIADLARAAGPSFLVLGFLARLPLAMLPLGMLLLVSEQTGSFTSAGAAVAGLSVGGAAGGTLVGHLADRYGHRAVGLVATGLLAALLGSFVVVATRNGGPPLLVALAVGVGLANPQIGSLARSRWLEAGAGRADRDTFVPAAMGYEGAADESSFVLGPVLVGVLALAGPAVGLWCALGIAVLAQVGFACHSSAARPQRPDRGTRTPVPVARVLPLAAVLASVGLVFGASQTGVTAKLGLAGHGELTGPVYAAMGLGSAVSAVLVGRLLHRVSLRHRIVGSGVGLSLTTAVLLVAAGPVALAVACLLVGFTVAPVMVSAYALVERVVPPGRSATVMAVLATAGTVGVALGAAASGVLIDQVGVRPAQLIPVAAGLFAAAGGLVIPATSQEPSRFGGVSNGK